MTLGGLKLRALARGGRQYFFLKCGKVQRNKKLSNDRGAANDSLVFELCKYDSCIHYILQHIFKGRGLWFMFPRNKRAKVTQGIAGIEQQRGLDDAQTRFRRAIFSQIKDKIMLKMNETRVCRGMSSRGCVKEW
jgi:hypothetical protein